MTGEQAGEEEVVSRGLSQLQFRDRSLFSGGGGGGATILGGRVIIFFKPSRGGSQFFSSLQGEGHIFLMVEHYLEQPTI